MKAIQCSKHFGISLSRCAHRIVWKFMEGKLGNSFVKFSEKWMALAWNSKPLVLRLASMKMGSISKSPIVSVSEILYGFKSWHFKMLCIEVEKALPLPLSPTEIAMCLLMWVFGVIDSKGFCPITIFRIDRILLSNWIRNYAQMSLKEFCPPPTDCFVRFLSSWAMKYWLIWVMWMSYLAGSSLLWNRGF